MKKDNYRVQNGCYNCGHCFIKGEWDSEADYYCHIDKSKRPLCGSVWMKEAFCCQTPPWSWKKKTEAYRAWDKWAKKREVKAWGICSKWILRKEEQNEMPKE